MRCVWAETQTSRAESRLPGSARARSAPPTGPPGHPRWRPRAGEALAAWPCPVWGSRPAAPAAVDRSRPAAPPAGRRGTPRPRRLRCRRWWWRRHRGRPGWRALPPMPAGARPCGGPGHTGHGTVGQATAWPPGRAFVAGLGSCLGCCWAVRPCTDLSLNAKHERSRGPSLQPGCVVPAITGTTTPSDALSARCDFPLERLYAPAAPRPQRPGPRRASPVPATTFRTFRAPYAGRSLDGARQALPVFHGLRPATPGSAPPWSLSGWTDDAAGFA